MKVRNTFKKFKLNRVTGNLKTNLARIAQKIEDGGNKGIFKVTDMIRATVICETVDQMDEAY